MNKISLELFPLKYFSIYRRENKISERMRTSDFLYTGFRNSRNFVLAYIFRESPPSFIREFEGDLVQNIINRAQWENLQLTDKQKQLNYFSRWND